MNVFLPPAGRGFEPPRAAIRRHGSARVGQFTALAEELTDRDLGPFFQRWLYKRGKP